MISIADLSGRQIDAYSDHHTSVYYFWPDHVGLKEVKESQQFWTGSEGLPSSSKSKEVIYDHYCQGPRESTEIQMLCVRKISTWVEPAGEMR